LSYASFFAAVLTCCGKEEISGVSFAHVFALLFIFGPKAPENAARICAELLKGMSAP
jgi:hypothetical protein